MTEVENLRNSAGKASQLSLLPEGQKSNDQTNTSSNIIDPDRRLFNSGRALDSRYNRYNKTPITEDIQHKKIELRNIIGLPIARGKDPHINDVFYKYTVRRVCSWNWFKIFEEYESTIGEISEELNLKINEVSSLVDKLLNTGLNRKQQYHEFHSFLNEYRIRWKIPEPQPESINGH